MTLRGLNHKRQNCMITQWSSKVLLSNLIHCYMYNNSYFPFLNAGKKEAQLVLLDHGLYKELDFSTRFNYAALWKVPLFFLSFSHYFMPLGFLLWPTCCYLFPCSHSLQGLIFADAKAIKENSVKLGAGDDLYALFAGILTMRPWNRVIDPAVDHLVIKGTDGDRTELQVIFCWRILLCQNFLCFFEPYGLCWHCGYNFFERVKLV